MYICMYVYMYTCTYAYIYIYMYTCMFTAALLTWGTPLSAMGVSSQLMFAMAFARAGLSANQAEAILTVPL